MSKEKEKATVEQNKPETVELPTTNAVVEIPEDTIELEINATVLIDGKLTKVQRVMKNKEIQNALHEAAEGYIPTNAVIELTDEGRKYLEELKAEGIV